MISFWATCTHCLYVWQYRVMATPCESVCNDYKKYVYLSFYWLQKLEINTYGLTLAAGEFYGRCWHETVIKNKNKHFCYYRLKVMRARERKKITHHLLKKKNVLRQQEEATVSANRITVKYLGCGILVWKIFSLPLHNVTTSQQTKARQQSNLFALPLQDMLQLHKEEEPEETLSL